MRIPEVKNVEKYLSFVIVGLFAAIIALMVYWQAFDNGEIIDWQDVPGHKQTVSVGDRLKVYRQFCVTRPVDLHIEREIRDGITYQLPESYHSYEKGCFFLTVDWVVPASLPPGYYVYDTVVSFDVNPLKRKQDRLQPFFFVVRNSDGSVPEFREEQHPPEVVNIKDIPSIPEITVQEGYKNESIQIR